MAPNSVKSFYQSGSAVHIVKTRWGLRVVAETARGRLDWPKRESSGQITYQYSYDLSQILRSVLVPRAFRWLDKQTSK